ncbi:MAG: hypothetical protein ACR2PH_08915 [Desulfobulbia bacterium]
MKKVEFVRAWYENTEANQRNLMLLGYDWEVEQNKGNACRLDWKFLHTNEGGNLTVSDVHFVNGTPKGTQLDNMHPNAYLMVEYALDKSIKWEAFSPYYIKWIRVEEPTFNSAIEWRKKPVKSQREIDLSRWIKTRESEVANFKKELDELRKE